jgi:DNA-binding MarR family transcriptional regulator
MWMNDAAPFAEKEANDSTGFLLWQVTALWQRRIATALRPHGLTQVQFALLAGLLWLSQKERLITQAMLARHAKVDMMMTSQVLRTLESKGLIERRPHPHDARANILLLTKRGRACAWKAVPEVEQADELFFGELGARRNAFNGALRSLIDTSGGT